MTDMTGDAPDADVPDAAEPSEPEPEPETSDPPTRDEVRTMLADVLSEAHRKVQHGRVYDAEHERVRQGWIRAAVYAASEYRKLMRDEELEELAERMDRLEAESGEDVPVTIGAEP